MKSAFFRQMSLLMLVALLTLALLGCVLRVSFGSFLTSQQEQNLRRSARELASLTLAYGDMDALETNWDYRIGLSAATHLAETDCLLCDRQGVVRICSCSPLSCDHLGRRLTPEYLSQVLSNGEDYRVEKLPGLFEERRHLQALALEHGILLASVPATEAAGISTGLFRIFLYTAVAVWLAAVALGLLVSRWEVRPLRAMAQTVRRFGHGELSARAQSVWGSTREMDELVAAFNHMADSLERSDEQRREFVANVSHELKTPLTSVAGYLDGMADGTIPPEEHPNYLQVVSREVRRMSRLVKAMLEISRMQTEGLDPRQLSRFDLGDTAAQTLISFEQKIRSRRLEVDLQLPEQPVYVLAHRDAITQVLHNLTDNAVKFCNDCGCITIALREEETKAVLSVKNTGPTIPADQLPLIFDRFHKLDKSRSQDPDGVGLGLYIVKTILGAHGENIRVESHDGATTFTLTLPLAK